MINCITKHISVEGSPLVFHLQSRALAQHPEHVFPQWMYEPLENSYTSTRARHAAPFSSPLDIHLTILKGREMKCANLHNILEISSFSTERNPYENWFQSNQCLFITVEFGFKEKKTIHEFDQNLTEFKYQRVAVLKMVFTMETATLWYSKY